MISWLTTLVWYSALLGYMNIPVQISVVINQLVKASWILQHWENIIITFKHTHYLSLINISFKLLYKFCYQSTAPQLSIRRPSGGFVHCLTFSVRNIPFKWCRSMLFKLLRNFKRNCLEIYFFILQHYFISQPPNVIHNYCCHKNKLLLGDLLI